MADSTSARVLAIEVRPFAAADQAGARRLVEDSLGEHFGYVDRAANPDLVDIAASYGRPPNAFLVAASDGQVVGTTGLIAEGHRVRLVRVAVARDLRRAGVATALLERAVALAHGAGFRELVAHTQSEWEGVVAFYRAHGFEPYGRDELDVYLRRPLAATLVGAGPRVR
jgi:N-acetylglutamate synthase-like GNAT family acetyltransferase